MMTMKKNILLLLGALLLLTLPRVAPAAASPNPQTQHYLKQLNSPSTVDRIRAAKEIHNAERVGPRVFERVEQILLAGFMDNPLNTQHVDEMSWMCKALASSGIATYEKSLRMVADRTPSQKIRKHALQSIDQLSYFRERGQIHAGVREAPATMSPENMKLLKMLQATSLNLQKDAAKILTRRNTPNLDPQLYNIVEGKLLSGYQLNTRDRQHVDLMAWFCKALGASGLPKYRNTLEKVLHTSSNRKLQKYAKQALEFL